MMAGKKAGLMVAEMVLKIAVMKGSMMAGQKVVNWVD